MPAPALLIFLLSLVGCAARSPTDTHPDTHSPEDTADTTTAAPPVLLVSAYTAGTVLRVDPVAGTVLGDLGSVPGAQSVHPGPDGALYIAAETANQILRWSAETNTSAPFVFDDPATEADETGGLSAPTSAVWGPDGLLYVGGYASDSVHRYDAQGRLVDVFAQGIAGLDGPDAGMRFGPDGDLYVPCFESDQVVVLDGTSGEVVRSITDGTAHPRALHFDADGTLWVSAWGSGKVLRFQPDGTRLDDLSTRAPTGIAVGSEGVWLSTDQDGDLRLLDPSSGERLRTIEADTLGVTGVTSLTWAP